MSRDVKLAIKHSAKKTAPGPDRQKLTDVATIPRGELVGLFNLWLYTGVCPTELCEGCTLLIPKEAGVVDPAKFWPIPVSSVVLRLFHKLLLKGWKPSVLSVYNRRRSNQETESPKICFCSNLQSWRLPS